MTIQAGDVVFVMHHASWVSRVFGWFMDGRWSHSAMVAEVGQLDIYLHETSDTQTKVGLLSRYETTLQDEIEVWRLPLVDAKAPLAAARYHDAMYGYARLVGAGVRRLFMKLGWRKCPMLWPWGGPLCMMIPHTGLATAYKDMPAVGAIDTQELYDWVRARGKLVASKRRSVLGMVYSNP